MLNNGPKVQECWCWQFTYAKGGHRVLSLSERVKILDSITKEENGMQI
jgi:hypothetical protein